MTSLEQQRALYRSAVWIARRIDLRYATDRELLQIIAQQPANLWQGSGRALAARWEARRRGLRIAGPIAIDALGGAQPVPRRERNYARSGRVQTSEPDALLVSLILQEPPDDGAGTQPVPAPGHTVTRRAEHIEADALLASLILHDPV